VVEKRQVSQDVRPKAFAPRLSPQGIA
jgi:hypothetical protein